MRCCHCKKAIAAGAEAQKMVVEYEQPAGDIQIYGYLMPDGPLTQATGVLLRGWHHKCYHVVRKREARGDAITGRVITGGINTSAYTDPAVSAGREVRERMAELTAVARRVGKPIGDPEVTEAALADQRGTAGHQHRFPVEAYRLLGHLRHGHHLPLEDMVDTDLAALHHRLHLRADRDADPGHTEPPERDWREQHAVDL